MPDIILVAAVADNGVIGQEGGLPWRLKSDMAHFRAVTMGKPVVMGRKTYTSIGGPLKGRTNIIVTRDRFFADPGVVKGVVDTRVNPCPVVHRHGSIVLLDLFYHDRVTILS